MTRSFKCKEYERLFNLEPVNKIPAVVQKAALEKLSMLDAAAALHDLRGPPGNKLESLKGDRQGQYSSRVNGRFRVCFVWQGADAWDVEIADYH